MNSDPIIKLAKILRSNPEPLILLEHKLNAMTGKGGIMARIVQENEIIIERVLNELGIGERAAKAETVHAALIRRIEHIDAELFKYLDEPDLSRMSRVCGKLCDLVEQLHKPKPGLFLRKEILMSALRRNPPTEMLEHFGSASIDDLVHEQGFEQVVCALRFVQSQEWMHHFFEVVYQNIRPDDFEERESMLLIMNKEWLAVAEKFLKKKYHNVSHLKELGIIFVIPLPLDIKGETVRMLSLILHYLHEIEFYSDLFRQHLHDPDFSAKIQSLLRGDVVDADLPKNDGFHVRIVQRYLAKDNPSDSRLFEPHLNPEAEHWYSAERDFGRLTHLQQNDGLDTGYWTGLDFVGDYFMDGIPGEQAEVLVSFDLIDLAMSLVMRDRIKYLYHQQEALWNKIFFDYFGPKECRQLIRENMFRGYITFK